MIGKWGTLTSIIAGAPSASLASSGTSALPREFALLGTEEVAALWDFAVVGVIILSSSCFVLGPVILPIMSVVVKLYWFGLNIS